MVYICVGITLGLEIWEKRARYRGFCDVNYLVKGYEACQISYNKHLSTEGPSAISKYTVKE